jgi:hypothetical protein
MAPGSGWMRRALTKSLPFFQAILIGTLACAIVAALALFITHS